MNNEFLELTEQECVELDGGIGIGAATWAVIKVVGICAGAGFTAGCAYELVFGKK